MLLLQHDVELTSPALVQLAELALAVGVGLLLEALLQRPLRREALPRGAIAALMRLGRQPAAST